MNFIKNHLWRIFGLTAIALFLALLDPSRANIALAEIDSSTRLIPVPNLQAEQRDRTLMANINSLPTQVQSAVLEDAARRTSQTVAALRIIEVQQKTWSDGCLELARPDELCTQVVTRGWRIVVTDGQNTWTYHTNALGSLVKLDNNPKATNAD